MFTFTKFLNKIEMYYIWIKYCSIVLYHKVSASVIVNAVVNIVTKVLTPVQMLFLIFPHL